MEESEQDKVSLKVGEQDAASNLSPEGDSARIHFPFSVELNPGPRHKYRKDQTVIDIRTGDELITTAFILEGVWDHFGIPESCPEPGYYARNKRTGIVEQLPQRFLTSPEEVEKEAAAAEAGSVRLQATAILAAGEFRDWRKRTRRAYEALRAEAGERALEVVRLIAADPSELTDPIIVQEVERALSVLKRANTIADILADTDRIKAAFSDMVSFNEPPDPEPYPIDGPGYGDISPTLKVMPFGPALFGKPPLS